MLLHAGSEDADQTESSLGAHFIALVLSCGGSFILFCREKDEARELARYGTYLEF